MASDLSAMWCCVGTAAAEERGGEDKVYIWERAQSLKMPYLF